jgi:hypothetical protein
VERTADGRVEFPFETVKVEFKLHALSVSDVVQPSQPMRLAVGGQC